MKALKALYRTECTEILKLLCVALLDDHLALECDMHPFDSVRAHPLQLASMHTIAVTVKHLLEHGPRNPGV